MGQPGDAHVPNPQVEVGGQYQHQSPKNQRLFLDAIWNMDFITLVIQICSSLSLMCLKKNMNIGSMENVNILYVCVYIL